jgi:hypothetical protein
MTAGRGFLVNTAVIFGGWTLTGTMLGCFLFGGTEALRLALPALGYQIQPQLLTALTEVTTETLDLTGATADQEFAAALVIPEGFRLTQIAEKVHEDLNIKAATARNSIIACAAARPVRLKMNAFSNMSYIKTVVLPSGPPDVMTWINANESKKANDVFVTSRNRLIGVKSGNVMYRNRCHPVAPSTRAASMRSCGRF